MSTILTEVVDFQNIENKIISESVSDGKTVKSIYLIGPHLQSEVKNHNGRIYPKAVIEREVKRINETKIKDNRFIGELEHPECYTKTAKILTEDGWKFIKDISNEEKVYTLNTSTNEIELQQITKKIDQPYKGVMYKIELRNLKTIVTPNHRFLVVTSNGEYDYITAEDLYNNPTKHSHSYIPKLGNWMEETHDDTFLLKGLVDVKLKNGYTIDPESDSIINLVTFVQFLGIWLSEGYVIDDNKIGNGYKSDIGIIQKKGPIKSEIREMLSKFPPEMKWKEYVKKNGTSIFILRDLRLATYLRENFGFNCYNKRIYNKFKNLSAPYLKELFTWFQKGDGRNQNFKGYNSQNVFTVSQQLILDLNEILFKSGGSGNITEIQPKHDYYFANHLIKAKNKSTLYQLNVSTTNGVHLDKRFINIDVIDDFDDRIYCVTVPNSNFYCMDNGKTFWSGNSLSINLERVSHITTMLKMEGNDAIGKSKLLDTPLGMVAKKLIEGGVKLGVSSRGSGTLRESIVQSDFSLVCVDIISDPSGPNCFMDSIVESNTEWVMENGILTEKEIEVAKQEIDKIIIEHTYSIDDKRAAFLKLFNEILTNIGNKYK